MARAAKVHLKWSSDARERHEQAQADYDSYIAGGHQVTLVPFGVLSQSKTAKRLTKRDSRGRQTVRL